jgi:hypothetical protein
MSAATVVPNEEPLKQEAISVIEKARIVKIYDQGSYDQATDLLLNAIKPLRTKWKNFWYGHDDGPVPLAYRAYKSVLSRFNEADAPLEAAERQVKAEINRFDQEQERYRQKLQQESDAAKRQRAEEERQNAAAVAEDLGASEEEVQAIAETPVVVMPAAPIMPTYQKASGVSTRENYKARVTDIKKLCAAVAKGTVPVSYVEPNMPALNARAKADRLTMNVPGVVPYNDPIVAGKSR